MSQLTNLAFFRARPGQTQALGSALSALIAPTRAEAECLNYNLHQSIDDDDVWFVYENWRSAEGSEAHMRTPHVQAFLLGELLRWHSGGTSSNKAPTLARSTKRDCEFASHT
jgi:quinol monooxygenase YgiN